ncbi:MAG: phosphatase PAP2 family protein [Chloroflexota bacterium]
MQAAVGAYRGTGRAAQMDRVNLKSASRQMVSPELSLARGHTALLIAGAALAGFGAILGAVMTRRSDAIDLGIAMRIQSERHASFAALMEAVSWPGFPPQSRVIPPVVIAALVAKRHRTEALFLSLAWGSALIATVVKAVVRRPRPLPEQVRVILAPLGGSSFPSGHVLTYVGVYGFMAFVAHTTIASDVVRPPVAFGLVGLVCLIGPSRIYQGHHWPTDVAASYTLGMAYLVGLIAIYQRVKAREV